MSKIITIGPTASLDGDTLMRLQKLTVPGYFTWEDLCSELVLRSIIAVLAGDLLLGSPVVLRVIRATLERRSVPRVEGLASTPEERARRATTTTRMSVTLWADDPDLADSLQFLFARRGIALDVVYCSEALLRVAAQPHPDHVLVIDCTTVKDACARCAAIITHTSRPIVICHPDKEFVDDLRPRALGPLQWLPPSYTGLSLLHKLDAFMIESPLAPTPPAPPPAPQPISTPLPVSITKEADPLSSLSEREREVLSLVVAGVPYAEIATQLFITQNTVKSHAAHIRTKLGLPAHQDLGRTYRQWHEGMTTG